MQKMLFKKGDTVLYLTAIIGKTVNVPAKILKVIPPFEYEIEYVLTEKDGTETKHKRTVGQPLLTRIK